MTEPYELSATAAVRAMRSGSLSASELITSLMDRIAALDDHVQAWETREDTNALLSLAAALDAARLSRHEMDDRASDLAGLPLGVKDIFLTRGLRTTAGFAPYAEWVPDRDAAVVAALRQRGAIVLGKTVTTQFAFSDPSRTVNPWRADRTPGGSSSGSAAAVATRMVPLALGTQTAGSVLRPAAYCGVIGFKPSAGRLSTDGVLPLAWSLDHVGLICREVADAALVLGERPPRAPEHPTFGLLTDLVAAAEVEVRDHTLMQAQHFAASGGIVREVRLPLPLEDILAIHWVTMQSEVTAVHAVQLARHPHDYAPLLRQFVETGQFVPAYVYHQAQRLRARFAAQIAALFEADGIDALLLPTASNTAPGRETTGDTRFQAIWTLVGLPSISLPSGVSAEGLPFGLQLVGSRGKDAELLDVAAWCEGIFGTPTAPPVG
jgi:Asp-tRNA(Asn)/Glu-tRNA(Gln) amidotransferase A subunit family amidase